MQFNSEHKVIISTLTRIEAKVFIKFLESEIVRHEDDITLARELITRVKWEILRCPEGMRKARILHAEEKPKAMDIGKAFQRA